MSKSLLLEVIQGFMASFAMVALAMPVFLIYMRRLGWGQAIREEGPADHHSKAGVPTMGGLVLVLGAFLVALLMLVWDWKTMTFWGFTLAGLAFGFSDDLNKVLRKQNLGLKARHKLLIQGVMGTVLALVLYLFAGYDQLVLPWGITLSGWVWVFPLVIVALTGTMNAVNLADGLDGLASTSVFFSLFCLSVIAWWMGETGLFFSSLILAGGCLGFWWYNAFPAKVFMGDTGSMALGAALATGMLMMKLPLLLVVLGFLYVVVALSVILQVAYFKATGGKRIFRMSPLHHHFCLGGMHEVQVTTRFSLVSLLSGCLSLYLLFQFGPF